jgi:hypothetical protein
LSDVFLLLGVSILGWEDQWSYGIERQIALCLRLDRKSCEQSFKFFQRLVREELADPLDISGSCLHVQASACFVEAASPEHPLFWITGPEDLKAHRYVLAH